MKFPATLITGAELLQDSEAEPRNTWGKRVRPAEPQRKNDSSEVSQKPEPIEPEVETLYRWMDEGGCEATDGCWVEPDGVCEHGCNSWLLEMGLI